MYIDVKTVEEAELLYAAGLLWGIGTGSNGDVGPHEIKYYTSDVGSLEKLGWNYDGEWLEHDWRLAVRVE